MFCDVEWRYVTLCDAVWHYVTMCDAVWRCVTLCWSNDIPHHRSASGSLYRFAPIWQKPFRHAKAECVKANSNEHAIFAKKENYDQTEFSSTSFKNCRRQSKSNIEQLE